MFWIAEQIVDFIVNHRVTWLLIVWTLGIIEYSLFAWWWSKYRPYINNYRVPVSVVVSVFREKPELFEKCLGSIKKQMKNEDELLIVFDGEDIELQKIGMTYGTIFVKPHGGKRSTLSYGCDRAKNSVILTMDSDTILCPDCLDELIKPFKNKKIGAVSAHQRIFDADSNIASKFADYNELMAHDFLQMATSAAGNVPVLYGRCLAFRKEVWEKIGYRYRNRMFLGRPCESGDDNDLTILTIEEGYNTFMQSTAKVTSDCPRNFWKRLKQQYRFSKSSMRVTIADWLKNPKLILNAKLGFINQMTAIVFPFLILGVWMEWIWHMTNGYESLIELSVPIMIFLTLATLISTLCFRNIVYLEKKKDIGIWILYTFYAWLFVNILNIICILTIFIEESHLVQYSRNE